MNASRGHWRSILSPTTVGLATLLSTSACPGDSGGDGDSTPTGSTTTSTAPSSGSDAGPTTNGTTPTDPDTTQGPGSTTNDTTDTTDPTTGEIPPNCGDGITDPDEACDDANMVDSDGCNTDCTISGSVLWFHTQASGVDQPDQAFAITVDDQGRAYVAGDFFGAIDLDFWVRQYDGEALGWTWTSDGVGNEGGRAIALRDDTLYVAGYQTVPAESNNVRLRTFDLDGNPGLNISFNDPLNGNNVGYGVAVDPSGNIVVVSNEAVAMQSNDIWVRKHDPAGTPLWTRGYNGPASGNDQSRGVAIDSAGNIAVVGFHAVIDQGRDIWIRTYDTDGNELWTATPPSGLAMQNDEAWDVAFDPEGNVVVAGFESDTTLQWRLWLAKYDPMGMQLWTQLWDGEAGEGARAFAVAVDDTGDIVVTGQHRTAGFSQLLVRKVDPNGNERWTTLIDGAPETDQVGWDVAIGPGRRIWVAGGVDQDVDGLDVYVARLAP